ncbi:MAG: glycosyltransferase family 1 protein [Deltaproteobacteria bacterium]|nr:glycosyltransferase family 1 protein [Deltaproteobacteria bacterium]
MKTNYSIAFVTETYPPEINGVAKTVSQVVTDLHRRGHSLKLFRPHQGTLDHPDPAKNFEHITLPGFRIPFYRDLRFGLPSTQFLVKAWAQNPPDLVHVVTEGPLGWSAVRAARKLSLPVISDFRTNYHLYSRYYRLGILSGFAERYLRYLHNNTHCTLVPTREIQESLTKKGYKNVSVVGRGIDANFYSPTKRDPSLRASWGLGDEDMGVLFVGRLAPEKNIQLTVEAFLRMKAQNPRLRLVLVGDGPSRNSLESTCSDVIFAGMQSGEALARHYASADMFLFPSITETFGNVILEAMASGLAIVSFNYAAALEYLVDFESGLLAPYNNRKEFIERAVFLAGSKEMVEKLKRRSQSIAKLCTWESVLSRLEDVYLSIIKPQGVS